MQAVLSGGLLLPCIFSVLYDKKQRVKKEIYSSGKKEQSRQIFAAEFLRQQKIQRKNEKKRIMKKTACQYEKRKGKQLSVFQIRISQQKKTHGNGLPEQVHIMCEKLQADKQINADPGQPGIAAQRLAYWQNRNRNPLCICLFRSCFSSL